MDRSDIEALRSNWLPIPPDRISGPAEFPRPDVEVLAFLLKLTCCIMVTDFYPQTISLDDLGMISPSSKCS